MDHETIYIVTEFLTRGHRFLNEKFGSKIKEKAFYSGGLVLNAFLDDGTYVAVVYPYQLIDVKDAAHIFIDEDTWNKCKHYLISILNKNNITLFREVVDDHVVR